MSLVGGNRSSVPLGSFAEERHNSYRWPLAHNSYKAVSLQVQPERFNSTMWKTSGKSRQADDRTSLIWRGGRPIGAIVEKDAGENNRKIRAGVFFRHAKIDASGIRRLGWKNRPNRKGGA